ncbi:MAG: hypothetical protein IJJ33_13995 [Victivallales bacterium]|nr:hypothetical protein [Victivallales bacterium]
MPKVKQILSKLLMAVLPTAIAAEQAAIVGVKSYGFVDLEGAKISAIIVEYPQEIKGASVDASKFEITDYAIQQIRLNGHDAVIETDLDAVKGNEGRIKRVYVNTRPEPSPTGGTELGRYVVIEVNTAYILAAQNLVYRQSMIAGVTQTGAIEGVKGTIPPNPAKVCNYTMEEQRDRRGTRTVAVASPDGIILPEFGEGSGWTINRIGAGAFQARHCYSEYTSRYEDFELPYAIFVPKREILEANKGKVALTLHMEHAGANSTDPLASLTSSRAAVRHAGREVQSARPTIVVVPQIEESRRATNDQVASSEANAAIWQLLDSILEQYKGFIDENRIYGTGQSMGGMCILNMAAQRDNFFAGILAVGAQWSSNYDKMFQNGGDRTPDNDTASFNGFGLDRGNFRNWYYMVSDDNILVETCTGDLMATGEWRALADYYEAAGVKVPYVEWDPFASVEEQEAIMARLLDHDTATPGGGIVWAAFTRGSHMSTWKYGYRLEAPFRWLYSQTRDSEIKRGKINQLKNQWLGRDENGKIRNGSGTANLNSAQFTPHGPDPIFTEGWTRETVTQAQKNTERLK